MLNYFYKIEDTFITYTIDMLRLSIYLKNKEADDFRQLLQVVATDYYYSNSNKIGTYSHNYKIDNIWIGVGCVNTKDITIKQLTTIEFNPNKQDESKIKFIREIIKKFGTERFFLKRFDIAIDLPFNICNLNFENLNKRSCMTYYEYQDNKTIYFGKGNGHTKIYNKKIESNLDYDLTRYEITKETNNIFLNQIEEIKDLNFNFLKPIILPYNVSTDNKTYNAIAYALNNGFHFKDLSRDMQQNIRKNSIYNIDLDENLGRKCVIDTIRLFTDCEARSVVTILLLFRKVGE